MKKYTITILIVLTFVFTGCKKDASDDDTKEDTGTGTGTGNGSGTTTGSDTPSDTVYTIMNKIKYGIYDDSELRVVTVKSASASATINYDQCLSLKSSQFTNLKITWRTSIVCDNSENSEKKCPSPDNYELKPSKYGVTWDFGWNAPKLYKAEKSTIACTELK